MVRAGDGGAGIEVGIIRYPDVPLLERFLLENHGFRVQLR